MLNLEKLEALPTKESHRINFLKNDFYGDEFKKSANEFYGRGQKYARAVLTKSINKPVKGVIGKLRSHLDNKHSSFKAAIEYFIKYDILQKLTVSPYFYGGEVYYEQNVVYVDDLGFIRKLPFEPTFKKSYVEKTPSYFKVESYFIQCVNGIHYQITKSYYDYLKFEDRYAYLRHSLQYFTLKEELGNINFTKFQLSKKILKRLGLKNEVNV